MQLPPGGYELRYAAGWNWYGWEYLFGTSASYGKLPKPIVLAQKPRPAAALTVELIPACALPISAAALNTIIPDNPNQAYDIQDVIRAIVDNGEFFEPHQFFAPNILVCFARLNGRTIGIIANQPNNMAGCLDINASDKATRFIRFCDAFNIPMLTIADVPGYLPGSQQEWNGIIRHGAKLLWCYSEATVPKLLLVTRKDYGGSYLAMCSKDLGADMAFAWPTAEIAVMGAEGASNIIHRRDIKEAADPVAKRKEKIEEYKALFSNPYCAASRGYIDAVIEPSETRPRLIEALEVLCTKRELRPPKKHGNIPM